MIRAALGNHEKIFYEFVRHWIRLLSVGKFDEAVDQIDGPNSHGIEWSAEAIKRVLNEYMAKENHIPLLIQTKWKEMEGQIQLCLMALLVLLLIWIYL